jgi:hypothetical protein
VPSGNAALAKKTETVKAIAAMVPMKTVGEMESHRQTRACR